MDGNGSVSGMLTSGLISAVVGIVTTIGLSLLMPFPWGLSRTLVCVGIASFCGAALGFLGGVRLARRPE